MNEGSTNFSDDDLLRSKRKKNQSKPLKEKIKYLEDKLDKFRTLHKESRLNTKKMNKKLRILQSSNTKYRQLLKTARHNLIKERSKKKELKKKLIDQEKSKTQTNINSDGLVNKDKNDIPTTSKKENNLKIAQKYKELFSDDFICGICLELFIEPVSATCGHSFCKFCINEWLKRNQNRRSECPMCRSSCKGYFKNVIVDNIIQKYLATADQEILGTRKRLIVDREKVIESSKNDPNNEINDRRVLRFDLNNHFNDENRLIEVFNNRNFNFFGFNAEDISSNEDDFNEDDEIDYFNEDFDNEEGDFSEDEEDFLHDIVLE